MDAVRETLSDFLVDFCEYLPPEIPRLTKVPTACEFLNNYVVPNSPVIIRPEGGFFPKTCHLWKRNYNMMELMKNAFITVHATPDGKADSIVDGKFMLPQTRRLKFNRYLDTFYKPQPIQVLYVQQQNNNLIKEFPGFVPHLSKDVPWATEAFGAPPEAANLWMGDNLSFTSMHKDHYENLYFVITGAKTFRIFPPVSIIWMPYIKVPKFQWYWDGFLWLMEDLNEEITWIRPNLQPETREKFKLFLKTKSYTVTIKPGDCLYLPAMWFHEVNQEKETVAVNYWYDMTYEHKFPYYSLLETLTNLPNNRRDASTGVQPELEDQLILDIIPEVTPKGVVPKDPTKKKF